jgi:hypothetical protein
MMMGAVDGAMVQHAATARMTWAGGVFLLRNTRVTCMSDGGDRSPAEYSFESSDAASGGTMKEMYAI